MKCLNSGVLEELRVSGQRRAGKKRVSIVVCALMILEGNWEDNKRKLGEKRVRQVGKTYLTSLLAKTIKTRKNNIFYFRIAKVKCE